MTTISGCHEIGECELQSGQASLVVLECEGCGFHLGVDHSYLDQVGGIAISCPASGCSNTFRASYTDLPVSRRFEARFVSDSAASSLEDIVLGLADGVLVVERQFESALGKAFYDVVTTNEHEHVAQLQAEI